MSDKPIISLGSATVDSIAKGLSVTVKAVGESRCVAVVNDGSLFPVAHVYGTCPQDALANLEVELCRMERGSC
jgi:hypothetical protein